MAPGHPEEKNQPGGESAALDESLGPPSAGLWPQPTRSASPHRASPFPRVCRSGYMPPWRLRVAVARTLLIRNSGCRQARNQGSLPGLIGCPSSLREPVASAWRPASGARANIAASGIAGTAAASTRCRILAGPIVVTAWRTSLLCAAQCERRILNREPGRCLRVAPAPADRKPSVAFDGGDGAWFRRLTDPRHPCSL